MSFKAKAQLIKQFLFSTRTELHGPPERKEGDQVRESMISMLRVCVCVLQPCMRSISALFKLPGRLVKLFKHMLLAMHWPRQKKGHVQLYCRSLKSRMHALFILS